MGPRIRVYGCPEDARQLTAEQCWDLLRWPVKGLGYTNGNREAVLSMVYSEQLRQIQVYGR